MKNMPITPTSLRVRYSKNDPFSLSRREDPSIKAGIKRMLTEKGRMSKQLAHTAFLCPDMDHNLSYALNNGDLKIGYFTVVIRPFKDDGRPIPTDLSDARLELENVRLLYETDNSYLHRYARDAGIIFQELAIDDIPISGWMVSLDSRGSYPSQGYLGRPTRFFDRVVTEITLGVSDQDISSYLNSKTSGTLRYCGQFSR